METEFKGLTIQRAVVTPITTSQNMGKYEKK
jgi:hypothetical protein